MKNFIHFIFFFIANIGYAQVTDNFTTNSIDFKKTSKNQYTIIESSKTSNQTQQIGAPQLPVYTRSYVLPAGSTLTNVSSSNGSKTVLGNNIFVYPTQPPCALNGKPCPDFVAPDPAIYNSVSPFPATTTTTLTNWCSFVHVLWCSIASSTYLLLKTKT